MIRLLVILILAGLVALGAAWIADHDLVMTLTVGSTEIRTTVAVATALMLIVFAVLWLFLHIVFSVFTGLRRARRLVSERREPPPPPRQTAAAPEISPAPPRIP